MTISPQLLKLIDLSQFMSAEKKQWLHANLAALPDPKVQQLWQMLIKEQSLHLRHQKEALSLRKEHRTKKLKALSLAAEKQVQQSEARQVTALEAEFNNFPSEQR